LLFVCGLDCLTQGRDGVWDSPMATDYWVKRFGFMWAGGRSGMKGMEALQKTADLTYSNEIPTSVYNPSGMYGLKAMGVSFCFCLIFHLLQLQSSKHGSNLA